MVRVSEESSVLSRLVWSIKKPHVETQGERLLYALKIGQCKNNGNGRHKKTRPPRKVPGGLLYVRTKNPLTMAKIKKKIIKFIFLIKLLNLTLIKIRK